MAVVHQQRLVFLHLNGCVVDEVSVPDDSLSFLEHHFRIGIVACGWKIKNVFRAGAHGGFWRALGPRKIKQPTSRSTVVFWTRERDWYGGGGGVPSSCGARAMGGNVNERYQSGSFQTKDQTGKRKMLLPFRRVLFLPLSFPSVVMTPTQTYNLQNLSGE